MTEQLGVRRGAASLPLGPFSKQSPGLLQDRPGFQQAAVLRPWTWSGPGSQVDAVVAPSELGYRSHISVCLQLCNSGRRQSAF